MSFTSLRDFIELLKEGGEMKSIKAEVDWNLELSHIAKKNEEKGGPALLFENVKGYKTPVLTSVFSNTRRLAMAFGMPPKSTIFEMAKKWIEVTAGGGILPKAVHDGPIMENQKTGDDIDLFELPVPKYFPKDGGRYFGTAVSLVTKDPETGFINLGTYRMEILDKKSLGALILKGKDADVIMKKYQARGQLMPAAAVVGMDPRLFFLSAASLPYGVSEYDIAGALMGKPVEVIESSVTGLQIPADAEIVAEGFIDPDPKNYRDEGPFGEYTGYYSKGRKPQPWLNVKRVLHRHRPIFWGTSVGRPPTDNVTVHSLTKTAALWSQLNEMKVPGIQSVYFPESAGRFWAVVSVKQMYPGHGRHAGLAAFSTVVGNYGVKGVIVVDDDIRADDWDRVMWALSVRYNPVEDTEIIKKGRSTALDPSLPASNRHITSRILMDATIPYEWEDKPELVDLDKDIMHRVNERWSEFGI
ncbi:MAG: phenylphosphate carboxylase subunit beta [Firmicutes bacterium]|nr:phenylphosphate carboxylase subunit beta [Bacillota bacterium]